MLFIFETCTFGLWPFESSMRSSTDGSCLSSRRSVLLTRNCRLASRSPKISTMLITSAVAVICAIDSESRIQSLRSGTPTKDSEM